MKKFSFKEIKFYSGDYDQIKNEFDKGGVLVAPAASALANIDTDKQYYSSLKNSNIAILAVSYTHLTLPTTVIV